MEISTRQLCKECPILAKGKSLKLKSMVLHDSWDSIDVIWAEPKLVSWLEFWAQSTTKDYTRAKTMFNLSPIYSARKSSNHLLSINHKSVLIQTYIKQNIHKHQTQNFRRISPFGITPAKKAHKARTLWYRGPFRRFINTRWSKKY